MYASINEGCQGKSGPGKIHEVILVNEFIPSLINLQLKNLALADSLK